MGEINNREKIGKSITKLTNGSRKIRKTYLSLKEAFQKSAASLLVIRKLSPEKLPLGNMAFNSLSIWLKTKLNLVKFLRCGEFSSNIFSFPSLNSLIACLHFFWRFSIKILKYSLLFKLVMSLSYLE